MHSSSSNYWFLISLLTLLTSHVQCITGQPISCPDDVPYSYLEPGQKEMFTKCTTDPGSMKTIKVDKNATFCVLDELFSLWSESSDGNPFARCSDDFDLGNAFNAATNAIVNQLNSLDGCGFNFNVSRQTEVEWCNPQTTIVVEPIFDYEIWSRMSTSPSSTPAIAYGNWYGETGGIVRPEIAINLTQELSFYGCFSEQPCGLERTRLVMTPDGTVKNVQCLDVQTILLHEILHVLGLGHVSGSGCEGTDSSGNPCLTEEQYQQFSATQNLSQDPMYCNLYYNYMARNLSCYNICALKKLYCPAGSPSLSGYPRVLTETCVLPTSVHPTAATPDRPTLEVIPTQTRNSIRIQIGNWHGKLGVSIFTSAGTLMDNLEMSSETMSIDVSRYPSGSYFVRVGVNNVLLSATFVVVR